MFTRGKFQFSGIIIKKNEYVKLLRGYEFVQNAHKLQENYKSYKVVTVLGADFLLFVCGFLSENNLQIQYSVVQ